MRYVVGCMTGTSLDGLDAVLTRIEGEGLDMRASFVEMVSRPLGAVGEMLHSFATAQRHTAEDFTRTARALGELHADAIEALNTDTLDFVVAHGQTIYHNGPEHLSWQLFDPWPIVRRLNVPVCYDLRQADLIAGGQGAPITPIADWVMYREHANLIFNLGGICNGSYWDEDETIEGGDFSVCNLLLDGLIRRFKLGLKYDEGGAIASRGKADKTITKMIHQAIGENPGVGQTLGREQLTETRLDTLYEQLHDQPIETVLASAIEAIVHNLDEVVEATAPGSIVVAGGGARNAALFAAMKKRDTDENQWRLSDDLGIPCEAREAMGFAVLGALSQDGVAITLPQVTGAERPGLAGTWALASRTTDV